MQPIQGRAASVLSLFISGLNKDFVPLIYVFGASTGSKIDRIEGNIEHHPTEASGTITLGDKHCQVQKGSEVEDADFGAHFDVPEIYFGNIHFRDDFFQ